MDTAPVVTGRRVFPGEGANLNREWENAMSDMDQQPGERPEQPLPAAEAGAPGQSEEPSPEFLAWVESLGPGGADRVVAAGRLMSETGKLLSDAGEAAESNAVAPLEAFNQRAKILAARAEVSEFDWLSESVRGGQMMITSMLRGARGNQAMQVFRHRRAKEEFQAAISTGSTAIELLNRALDGLPQVPEYEAAKAGMQPWLVVFRHTLAFFAALEKNCDIDALLLEGRVGEYLAGVRALAGELRILSDGMLGSGADENAVLALSARGISLADTIEARAEAIEEIDASRPVYLPPRGDKIFVVHGHAEDKWRELDDLIENQLGLKGRIVVLKEEASKSQTVIAKFEEYAKQCCYCLALVTPDDEVKSRKSSYRQARPNVLFEIGWFYGRFGPRRVCILQQSGTAVPSDLGGVVTLEFQEKISEIYLPIKQELEAAGVIR